MDTRPKERQEKILQEGTLLVLLHHHKLKEFPGHRWKMEQYYGKGINTSCLMSHYSHSWRRDTGLDGSWIFTQILRGGYYRLELFPHVKT